MDTLRNSEGEAVELARIFELGFCYFHPNTKKTKDGKLVSDIGDSSKAHIGKRFTEYRQYLDSFKARNPQFQSLDAATIRGLAARILSVYEKFNGFPPKIMQMWTNSNMPFIILTNRREKIQVGSFHITKLHDYDATYANIDECLAKGKVVRTQATLDLSNYEVYTDGTIECSYAISDINELKAKLPGPTRLLNQYFAKRDQSAFADPKVEWLGLLTTLTRGESVIQNNIQTQQETCESIWYEIKYDYYDVTVPSQPKVTRNLKGTLISKNRLSGHRLKIDGETKRAFLLNLIPLTDIIQLGKRDDWYFIIKTYREIGNKMTGYASSGIESILMKPGDVYTIIAPKGSGKTQKQKILSVYANVEDSDLYGAFLYWYLARKDMLGATISEISKFEPDDDDLADSLDYFVSAEHDFDKENSYFALLADAYTKAALIGSDQMNFDLRIKCLLTDMNVIYDHPKLGLKYFGDYMALNRDKTRPTFIMCHSTYEGIRRTPCEAMIVLTDTFDPLSVIVDRDRVSTPSEILLSAAYRRGMSTTGSTLAFPILLERIRCKTGDYSLGSLVITQPGVAQI